MCATCIGLVYKNDASHAPLCAVALVCVQAFHSSMAGAQRFTVCALLGWYVLLVLSMGFGALLLAGAQPF